MYRSTRGKELVTSSEAILQGLAPDGGLYVINEVPKIDYKTMLNDDYITMATKVIHAYFPDFEYSEIYSEIAVAYSTFDIKEVVTLHEISDCYFLELFHGPTLAFKDLALVVLPRLMKLAKNKLNDRRVTTILTATSGDTGGAALNGFSNIEGINIFVLYPNGGVSPIQEAQMASFRSKNAHVIALNGNFDDCQSLVKEFFSENKDLNLSSANSINIARLVPQIVYYFYSYIKLIKDKKIKAGEEINFSVPTGNFGDIFAGFYAKMMGLPIKKLICASNKNKVLTDFFDTGTYNRVRRFYKTNSPSMDILISSNLERLLFYGNDSNPELTKNLMNSLAKNGSYDFNNPFKEFYADYADENMTLSTIKEVFEKENYLIDTHTAVAYKVYKNYLKNEKDDSKCVIVSTASPYKFPESILTALDVKAPSDAFEMIEVISKICNLEIPAVLNYPKPEREIWNLDEAKEKLRSEIKCLK